MTNRLLLPQSQDAGGNPRGGRAHTHGRGEEQTASLSSFPAPTRPSPTTHLLRALTGSKTHSHTAPAHTSIYTCRIISRVSNIQYGLPPTPPKCHTNIYTQSHPHTNTHQLHLHRHPHQRSPGLSPTQTEELSNKYPNFTPLGLLLSPPQQGREPIPVRGHAGQAVGGQRGDRRWRGRKTV